MGEGQEGRKMMEGEGRSGVVSWGIQRGYEDTVIGGRECLGEGEEDRASGHVFGGGEEGCVGEGR